MIGTWIGCHDSMSEGGRVKSKGEGEGEGERERKGEEEEEEEEEEESLAASITHAGMARGDTCSHSWS